MDLKDFIEQAFAEKPIEAMGTAVKLIELESIERYLNLMWGIKLDIKIVPAEKEEGRWYGKSVIDAIKPWKKINDPNHDGSNIYGQILAVIFGSRVLPAENISEGMNLKGKVSGILLIVDGLLVLTVKSMNKDTLIKEIEARKYVFERPKDDYLPEVYKHLKSKNEALDDVIALLRSK